MPNEWLRDLYAHQTWAESEHWKAIDAPPGALEDEAIRKRLHHIHFVQHAFLWTIGDRKTSFAMTKAEDFGSFDALRSYAREYHAQAGPRNARLADPPPTDLIFWFWKGRPAGTW
jgi:hypothetical protein